MPAHIVKCRTCLQSFDARKEDENIFWTMPTRNYYFHVKCYNDWKNALEHTEEDWINLIYDLIARDLKGEYSWGMLEAQRKKFIAQHMTNKGIYFSLYWYFIIKKNVWKEEYGIGIVPHIYKQATEYWIDKENKSNGILEQIERLAHEKIITAPIVVNKRERRKKNIRAPE